MAEHMTTDEFIRLVESYAEACSTANFYEVSFDLAGRQCDRGMADKYTATAAKLRTQIEEAFVNARYSGLGITIELPSQAAGTGG